MLRYHVVDRLLRLAKVVINAVDESRSRGSVVWLELKDDKKIASWSVLLGNFQPELLIHLELEPWQWQLFTVGMMFSGMVASYAILK